MGFSLHCLCDAHCDAHQDPHAGSPLRGSYDAHEGLDFVMLTRAQIIDDMTTLCHQKRAPGGKHSLKINVCSLIAQSTSESIYALCIKSIGANAPQALETNRRSSLGATVRSALCGEGSG